LLKYLNFPILRLLPSPFHEMERQVFKLLVFVVQSINSMILASQSFQSPPLQGEKIVSAKVVSVNGLNAEINTAAYDKVSYPRGCHHSA
jgi:hypothetical protein